MDPTEKINQLKIDRGAPAPARRNWLPLAAGLAVVTVAVVWWVFFRPGSATVLVEIDVAHRLPVAQASREL